MEYTYILKVNNITIKESQDLKELDTINRKKFKNKGEIFFELCYQNSKSVI